MLDHLETLPVDDLGHAVADGGNAVAQVGTPGPDINILMSFVGDKRPQPRVRASAGSRSPGSNPAIRRREKGEDFSITEDFRPVF